MFSVFHRYLPVSCGTVRMPAFMKIICVTTLHARRTCRRRRTCRTQDAGRSRILDAQQTYLCRFSVIQVILRQSELKQGNWTCFSGREDVSGFFPSKKKWLEYPRYLTTRREGVVSSWYNTPLQQLANSTCFTTADRHTCTFTTLEHYNYVTLQVAFSGKSRAATTFQIDLD